MGEASPGVQTFKYGAKELDRQNGINLYDSQARFYDPIICRTTTQDPLAEKYYSTSPYLWCAGNPMKYLDRDGKDVCVLLEQSSFHIAVLIQNEDKTWSYYSVNGDGSYSSGSFKGGKHFNDVEIGNWNSPQEFLDSDYNQKLPGRTGDSSKEYSDFNYDQGYIIKTTQSQDKSIKEKFKEISARKYDVLTENCACAVAKSLNEANILTKTHINTFLNNMISTFSSIDINNIDSATQVLPTPLFNNIKFLNPNGRHIYKSK